MHAEHDAFPSAKLQKNKQARNDNSAWQAGDFRAKTTSHPIQRGSVCGYPAISRAMGSWIKTCANGKDRVESVFPTKKATPRFPRNGKREMSLPMATSFTARWVHSTACDKR